MENKKWYQKPLWIVLLVIFFPVGLFVMWTQTSWHKNIKIGISLLVIILLVFAYNQPSPTVTTGAAPSPIAQKEKVITYEVFNQWDIPNGGKGKVIIISPTNFNKEDMPLLGKTLLKDTENDKNAFIFVFTDKKAAAMRDYVLGDDLTDEERDFYDKHYVATYMKNSNSDLKEMTIYYDGVLGVNSEIIKY